MKNRLRLDFSLQSTQERLDFLNSYLPTINFEPNEHETETLSDYILWGKNAKGLNAQQEGITTIKAWAPEQLESVEGLLDTPGFQESKFQKLGTTRYYTKRVVFDRDIARARATPEVLAALETLWDQIDRTELLINYYDLENGKRKTEPRPTLLKRFDEEEQNLLKQKAADLTQRRYLQLRHYLVELRTQQYTYQDSYITQIMPRTNLDGVVYDEDLIRFGEDIEVFPIGLDDNSAWAHKVFQMPPDPSLFDEDDLRRVSQLIWRERPLQYFDFENADHIISLYSIIEDLQTEGIEDPDQIYGAAASLVRTLKYYENQAKLNDLQREILQMKLQNIQNVKIMQYINEKYGTTYNDNYISTIYRQKIIPEITKAATGHRLIMENIFYPEMFKKCKDCGQLTLRDPWFFMRQHKNADGFSPRCKTCERLKRERLKEKKKNEQ